MGNVMWNDYVRSFVMAMHKGRMQPQVPVVHYLRKLQPLTHLVAASGKTSVNCIEKNIRRYQLCFCLSKETVTMVY